ncbi:glycogen debranching N-terminal domain-containing protein [Streptomyces sp. SAS_276]
MSGCQIIILACRLSGSGPHCTNGAARPAHADFRSILRGLGEVTPDPAVALHRRRTTADGRFEETFEITNAGGEHVRFTLTAGTDLATTEQVESGRPAEETRPRTPGEDGGRGHRQLTWAADDFTVRLTANLQLTAEPHLATDPRLKAKQGNKADAPPHAAGG